MSSIWGTGTMFYGDTDPHPRERSYVTTEWITIFFIPILPLRSYRIWTLAEDTEYSWFPPGITQTMEYEKVRVKFQWRQVMKTFLWGLLGWAFVAYVIYGVSRSI